MCVGHDLEQRLARLETLCKQKEEERVELELKLTEVKENLKKSLARGSAGPPTENQLILKVAATEQTPSEYYRVTESWGVDIFTSGWGLISKEHVFIAGVKRGFLSELDKNFSTTSERASEQNLFKFIP